MKDLKILGIDTSGKVASAALCDGGRVLWEKSVYTKLTHSQVILPMVKDALEECGMSFPDLDCAAVACGPGSYTGLRIGIGAVKGMCLGCPELKCAGVSTLMSLALNVCAFEGLIVPVMKARPGIVYGAVFESRGGELRRVMDDKVCPAGELAGQIGDEPCLLVGDWAEEFKREHFPESGNVRCAPAPFLLQRASSLCLAVEKGLVPVTDGDGLEVSYLQPTKAEKLADRKAKEEKR